MQFIQSYIAQKQSEISRHRFLLELRPEPDLERALWFAPMVAFWAMGFQDVIRMNAERVQDPELRRIIGHHRIEDAGHDSWYLEDLKAMGRRDLDIAWLYGEACRPTREATYAIAAEAVHAAHDVLRLVLILALEGAGHVLFGGVTRNMDLSGHSSKLMYFASSHLHVEKGHDLFAAEVQRTMEHIHLSEELQAQATAMVDRVFAAFHLLADGLVKGRGAAGAVAT